MSKRVSIENQIFGDIYVLAFERNKNSHALYKCLCMCCNSLVYVTYSNLVSKNTTKCGSCANKATSYKQECEILEEYNRHGNVSATAKKFKLSRQTIYRVIRDHQKWSGQ